MPSQRRLSPSPSAIALLLLSLLPIGRAPAQSAAAMYVEVFIRGTGGHDTKVGGSLVSQDESRVVVRTSAGEQTIAWDDMTANSAFTLKSRLIDRNDAGAWIGIGEWARAHAYEVQAKQAFTQAMRLDPKAMDRVRVVAPPAATREAKKPADVADAVGANPATPGQVQLPQRKPLSPGAIVKYEPSTPEESAAAIAKFRTQKAEAERILKLKLTELETDHFLIFTDWDPREYGFLRTEVEGAYRVLAKEFNRPTKENVFEGKLPIYMFSDAATFRRYADEVDDTRVPETVLGYFMPVDLMGHMAMWKPGIGSGIGAGGSLDEAKRRWGRTLAHEFCHAFIHRYISNAPIPRWMNEGLAEVIAERVLPTNNYYAYARVAAQSNSDVQPLFNDDSMPTGAAYPVMMTMVEMLVRRDRAGFLRVIDAIKAGTPADQAIADVYHLDRRGLGDAWAQYARGLK